MPVYNAEKFISDSIESVLNQIFDDFEFIIVDDCSLDDSWEIINKYAYLDNRFLAVKNTVNIEGCNNFNKAISLSKG